MMTSKKFITVASISIYSVFGIWRVFHFRNIHTNYDYYSTIIWKYNHQIIQKAISEYQTCNDSNHIQNGGEKDDLKLPALVNQSFLMATPCETNVSNLAKNQGSSTLRKETTSQKIPKLLHFLLPFQCIPNEVYNNTIKLWQSIYPDYTLMFHDESSINILLQERLSSWEQIFEQLSSSIKCTTGSEAKADLLGYLLLWEYGGIIVSNISVIPGDNYSKSLIEPDDDAVIVIQKAQSISDQVKFNITKHFMTSIPNHPFVWLAIKSTMSRLYLLQSSPLATQRNPAFNYSIEHMKAIRDIVFLFRESHVSIQNMLGVKKFTMNNTENFPKTISLINEQEFDGNVLHFYDNSSNSSLLKYANLFPYAREDCISFNESSYQSNIPLLFDVLQEPDKVCTNNETKYIPNAINDNIFKCNAKRKIPKIIHLTSPSHCYTSDFASNINKWRFLDHSFIIHDDDAVDRLFKIQPWPFFPLINDALKCIHTGAGKADFWRYLALWEFGGIYSDIDNAPGPLLRYGQDITNDMETYLEVESGRYPGQYFIASTPHHPLMYFTLHETIRRLFEVKLVDEQYVPFVTGPGALKNGMVRF